MVYVRLLHVSDLHLAGSTQTFNNGVRVDSILNRFYAQLRRIPNINQIVFTGDLINNNCDPAICAKIKTVVDTIVDRSKINVHFPDDYKNRIHIVPGHGDISSSYLTKTYNDQIDALRGGYEDKPSADQAKKFSVMQTRFADPFLKCCNQFYTTGSSPVTSPWKPNKHHGIRTFYDGHGVVTFIYLNSCLFHTDDKHPPIIGLEYVHELLDEAVENGADAVFILSHHSLEDIADKDVATFLDRIASDTDRLYFWLCGHKHIKENPAFSYRGKPSNIKILQTGTLTGGCGNNEHIPFFSFYQIDDKPVHMELNVCRFVQHLPNNGGWIMSPIEPDTRNFRM